MEYPSLGDTPVPVTSELTEVPLTVGLIAVPGSAVRPLCDHWVLNLEIGGNMNTC